MQQQRMHQDHIPRFCRVFQNLQGYAVDFFDLVVKPPDALRGVAGGAQVAQVGVSLEGLTQLRTASPLGRRVRPEPLVDQTV